MGLREGLSGGMGPGTPGLARGCFAENSEMRGEDAEAGVGGEASER